MHLRKIRKIKAIRGMTNNIFFKLNKEKISLILLYNMTM